MKRPSHATVVAYLALFVALGGSAYAVGNLGKNTVGAKQLKKNAVTTAKVKNEAITGAKVKKGTLTGAQINVSTLGQVPTAQTAQTAQTANSLPQPEPWHVIGTPGEPDFMNSWSTTHGSAVQPVAFYKDHENVVHLRGLASGGEELPMFALPPGFRPAGGKLVQFLVECAGPSGGCSTHASGRVDVFGPGYPTEVVAGQVDAPQTATLVSLEGISFRAES